MFQLAFKTANAAFDGFECTESARILREIANRLEDGDLEGIVRDVNGNTIGSYSIQPDDNG